MIKLSLPNEPWYHIANLEKLKKEKTEIVISEYYSEMKLPANVIITPLVCRILYYQSQINVYHELFLQEPQKICVLETSINHIGYIKHSKKSTIQLYETYLINNILKL